MTGLKLRVAVTFLSFVAAISVLQATSVPAKAEEFPSFIGTWQGVWAGGMRIDVTLNITSQRGDSVSGNAVWRYHNSTHDDPFASKITRLEDSTYQIEARGGAVFILRLTSLNTLSGTGTGNYHSGEVRLARK